MTVAHGNSEVAGEELALQMNRRLVELLSVEMEEVMAKLRAKSDSVMRAAGRIEKVMNGTSLSSPQEALRCVYQVKETQQKILGNRIVGQQLEHAVRYYLQMLKGMSTYEGTLDDRYSVAEDLLKSIFRVESATGDSVRKWVRGITEVATKRLR